LVELLTTRTLASGTTAPAGSSMFPSREAVTICPKRFASAKARHSKLAVASFHNLFRMLGSVYTKPVSDRVCRPPYDLNWPTDPERASRYILVRKTGQIVRFFEINFTENTEVASFRTGQFVRIWLPIQKPSLAYRFSAWLGCAFDPGSQTDDGTSLLPSFKTTKTEHKCSVFLNFSLKTKELPILDRTSMFGSVAKCLKNKPFSDLIIPRRL